MTLLIRADSGPRVGTGHVMRMLALAGAWKRLGGQTVFVCGVLPGTLRQRLMRNGYALETIRRDSSDSLGNDPESLQTDARRTAAIAVACRADWVVADGYAFKNTWQCVIKSQGFRLLVVDDFVHDSHEHADLILNQNIYAAREMYAESEANGRDSESILCGTKFLMMRSEFGRRELGARRKIAAAVKRILVTFGGADHDNHSLNVLRVLDRLSKKLPQFESMEVDLVCGPEFAHRARLDAFVETDCSIRVHRHHDVQRMSELMLQADLAISAGGSTCYELARCGVPAVVVSVAENQIAVARALQKRNSLVYAGHHAMIHEPAFMELIKELAMDRGKRTRISASGKQIVDGRGAGRIAERMAEAVFSLRPATMNDCEQLLAWRNEPETRAVSFRTQPIQPDDHRNWLARKLDDKNCVLQIAIDPAGNRFGQIRIEQDRDNRTAYISIALDSGHRGRGLGAMLIGRATRNAARSFDVDRVVAQIKPANVASKHAFANAGYQSIAPTAINGQAALQLAWIVNESSSRLKKSA